MWSPRSASRSSSSSAGLLPVAVARGQLYLGGKAAADGNLLRTVGATHLLALTQEPPQPVKGVVVLHCAPGGDASPSEALARLCAACDALEGALAPSAIVVVHCSRGPRQGGPSGAVCAAHLLRTGHCASLADALFCTGAQNLRGALLASLCALELHACRGVASDLGCPLLGGELMAIQWELPPPSINAAANSAAASGAATSGPAASDVSGAAASAAAASGADAISVDAISVDASGVDASGAGASGEGASSAAPPHAATPLADTTCGLPEPPRPTCGGDGDSAAAAVESIAVVRGAAMRVRAISKEPLIAAISGFVSAAEAAHLIERARARLAPSRVAGGATAGASDADGARTTDEEAAAATSKAAAWRSSTSCAIGGGAVGRERRERRWAREHSATPQDKSDGSDDDDDDDDDEVVARVVERAAFLCGLSRLHAEDVQVVHYTPGQQYREHCDYFSPTQDARYEQRTKGAGNRLVSLFCCLAPAAQGGATAFTRLGLSFELQAGEALLWSNYDRRGLLDARTLHAGRPVDAGDKWGCNVWLRQRPLVEASSGRGGGGGGGGGGSGGGSGSGEDGATMAAWRPARPPPRQTQAPLAAQVSMERRERD